MLNLSLKSNSYNLHQLVLFYYFYLLILCVCTSFFFFAFNHGGEGQGGGWTLSECCSQQEYGHPQAACQQRWGAAGQEGCPPCPGSSAWHCQ